MRGFRIVVAAHGGLADAFVSTAALVCGPLDDTAAVGLEPTDSPETFRDRLTAAIGDTAGRDRPLLLLTDLAGGTPHNVAMVVARGLPQAVLISGINLALLLEAAMAVATLDGESIDRLVSGGREALVDMGRVLAGRTT